MMDWSDRHCRYFFRQLAPHAVVYTEMVTTGALLHGDLRRHLAFDPAEHAVALQLGGSEPRELAQCARVGADWGYDEINLNCGCPSERVQKGAFGACLMAEPELVAECVRAMQDAAEVPVTVKHRLGVASIEAYDFVRRFVEIVSRAGPSTFIVHARNAVLKGLSPRENREVPPLRYEHVHRLKLDFPSLEIVINGGFAEMSAILPELARVDGVMLGRAAYHDSFLLARLDAKMFATPAPSRRQVIGAMTEYASREVALGTPLRAIARHMLGLYHGEPGARIWRRMLSDAQLLARNDPGLLADAMAATEARLTPALSPASGGEGVGVTD
jgi:tRNA-dihydrouridine synthase A